MNRSLFYVLVIFAALSCSEEIQPRPATYSEILSGKTKKTWEVAEVLFVKNGVYTSDDDLYFDSYMLRCEKDDLFVFYGDEEKTFEIQNGERKCDTEEDLLIEYTWSFVNAGAVLNIPFPRIFGNFVIPFTVTKLTDDEMVLQVFMDQENTLKMEVYLEKVDEE